MCEYCGEKIGCTWTGGRMSDVKELTADDWRLIYDFVRFVQLPFFHALVMRAKDRKIVEPGMKKGFEFDWVKCPVCNQKVKRNWYIRHVKSGCEKG